MSDTPLLPYDTAAAAAIWRRVSPALNAYPDAPLSPPPPAGEAALHEAIDLAAALSRGCRRCAHGAPRTVYKALTTLATEEQSALRALLAACYLLTGCWYQPALSPAVSAPPSAALRQLYRQEARLSSCLDEGSQASTDDCLRELLTQQAEQSRLRARRLMAALENSLTIGNNLLKW